MDAFIEILQGMAIFVAGLLARLGLVILVVVALAIIPALVWFAGREVRAVLHRWGTGLRDAGGFLFKRGVYYSSGHTWLEPSEGETLRVGIDDLAKNLIPWAVKVELPRPGVGLKAGEGAAAISCGGRELAIPTPVAGTVVAVNPAVVADPSLVKRDNYARGWLFSLRPADTRYLALRTGEPARSWLRSEKLRLTHFLEEELGLAAADGGEWIAPPPSLLQDAQWQKLQKTFLSP
jgi:glycine cleavage system H lipoate-binding protein